ncbi:hypothetical protein LZ009_08850 [Ramlibacter sp. XY19]|uniref:hypothetical protein n=1 Tax=Ramlibacter paludis TaxID=2908000 RepID=UPI0023DB09D1|nr:hypothetical protein [Ramlibacter paludis]MCG2592887.1 hypothetical protein [Ramlibacter paludis]
MQYSAKKNALLAVMVAAAALVAVDANAARNSAPAKPAAKTEAAVDVPPPSGTWESKPPPAEGYVWSTGYYEWKDGRYAWKKGEWVLLKEGMEYRQHKWVQRADGKYVLTGGDWVAAGDKVSKR